MRFVPRQSCHAHSPLVEEPLAHAVHMAVVDEVRHSVERADVAAPLRVSGCQKRTPSHQNKRATATGTKSERTLHATTCDEQTRRLTGKAIRGKRQPNTKIRPRLASPDRTGIPKERGAISAHPLFFTTEYEFVSKKATRTRAALATTCCMQRYLLAATVTWSKSFFLGRTTLTQKSIG